MRRPILVTVARCRCSARRPLVAIPLPAALLAGSAGGPAYATGGGKTVADCGPGAHTRHYQAGGTAERSSGCEHKIREESDKAGATSCDEDGTEDRDDMTGTAEADTCHGNGGADLVDGEGGS